MFSLKICDPLSFLKPVKFINVGSKFSKIKTTSLKVKFNFCSIK